MSDRQALRTALTAGLGNGFASLSGLADSQYVALAVLAVSSGSAGGALALGRQRLLGTLLGSGLLLVGHGGLQGLPMPLGLAITLASLRLLGGLLNLQVGYKVGGMIIVMGWLVHEGSLASWIPLRFVWTSFGVLLTLLAVRLFWPCRAIDGSFSRYTALLEALQACLLSLAEQRQASASQAAIQAAQIRQLRQRLVAVRRLQPEVLQELGSLASSHPAARLLAAFDGACSRLITLAAGLVREPITLQGPLQQSEAQQLLQLAEQLQRWQQQLRQRRGLPLPPPAGLAPPQGWEELFAHLCDPAANRAPLEQLERTALRLQLCRQAAQAIRSAEQQWATIAHRR
jgi:uncharacterized membrane protein YccC